MSKKIKILTPRIYEHSDFFHNAVDFAREHSLNTNELCLELSHYLVDNFEKIWKVEKPRIYKKLADIEAKLAESEKALEAKESVNRMYKATLSLKDSDFSDLVRENAQLKQQLAEKEQAIESLEELNRSLGQTCNNDKKEIERLNKLLAEKENQYNQLVFNSKYTSEEMIDFSVEQLEKVKEFCEDNYDTYDDKIDNCKGKVIGLDKVIFNADKSLYEFIDQQIKQLKEGE